MLLLTGPPIKPSKRLLGIVAGPLLTPLVRSFIGGRLLFPLGFDPPPKSRSPKRSSKLDSLEVEEVGAGCGLELVMFGALPKLPPPIKSSKLDSLLVDGAGVELKSDPRSASRSEELGVVPFPLTFGASISSPSIKDASRSIGGIGSNKADL